MKTEEKTQSCVIGKIPLGSAMNLDVDHLIINIAKEMPVEQSALVALRICEFAYRQGKRGIVWISFDGYDDDPREVWDIPKCGEWARQFILLMLSKKESTDLKHIFRVLGNDHEAKNTDGDSPGVGLYALLAIGWGRTENEGGGKFKMCIRDKDAWIMSLAYGEN